MKQKNRKILVALFESILVAIVITAGLAIVIVENTLVLIILCILFSTAVIMIAYMWYKNYRAELPERRYDWKITGKETKISYLLKMAYAIPYIAIMYIPSVIYYGMIEVANPIKEIYDGWKEAIRYNEKKVNNDYEYMIGDKIE